MIDASGSPVILFGLAVFNQKVKFVPLCYYRYWSFLLLSKDWILGVFSFENEVPALRIGMICQPFSFWLYFSKEFGPFRVFFSQPFLGVLLIKEFDSIILGSFEFPLLILGRSGKWSGLQRNVLHMY